MQISQYQPTNIYLPRQYNVWQVHVCGGIRGDAVPYVLVACVEYMAKMNGSRVTASQTVSHDMRKFISAVNAFYLGERRESNFSSGLSVYTSKSVDSRRHSLDSLSTCPHFSSYPSLLSLPLAKVVVSRKNLLQIRRPSVSGKKKKAPSSPAFFSSPLSSSKKAYLLPPSLSPNSFPMAANTNEIFLLCTLRLPIKRGLDGEGAFLMLSPPPPYLGGEKGDRVSRNLPLRRHNIIFLLPISFSAQKV